MKGSKNLIVFCCGVLILLATGCASMPKHVLLDAPPQIVKNTNNGQVYFFRKKGFVGVMVSYPITENGQNIGVLKNGTYFIVQAPSGTHTYDAETEATTSITLNIEAGKKYYVQGGVQMGIVVGRPKLELVSEDHAKPLIEDDLKYVQLEP